MADTTQSTFKKEVTVDGKVLVVEGTIGVEDLKVTVKDSQPPPPPPPDTTVDPNTGEIKTGTKWSTKPGPATTWEAVPMTDPDKKGMYKIITHSDNDLNVIGNIPDKDTADKLITYFKTHPFPPTTTPPPPPPPPPGPGPTEGEIVEGIKIPFARNGKIRTTDWNYNENNGLRVDYEGNTDGSYVNNAMAVYAQFVGKITTGEDRCFKWTWGHHHKQGDVANCYIVLARNGDGATRVRFEEIHPSGYSDLLSYGESKLGSGIPCKTGVIWGLMGVRRNILDKEGKKVIGVKLELWEDQGGMTKDGKPANQWKQIIDYTDTKKMITNYDENGIEITCRMDDDIGDKNIKVEKVLLVGLDPVKSTTT